MRVRRHGHHREQHAAQRVLAARTAASFSGSVADAGTAVEAVAALAAVSQPQPAMLDPHTCRAGSDVLPRASQQAGSTSPTRRKTYTAR